MLLDRYNLGGVSEVSEVSESLLGERIDSRKSYFAKLNRVQAGDKKRSFSGGGSRGGNVFSDRGYSQRVVVKIHYKKHSSGSAGAGNLRGHLGYITRDGSGLDGDRPELFGNALGVNEDISRSDFYNLCAGDRHHFRIIISPESGHELGDFEGYVTRVMGLVEKDLGTSLEWVSAVHRDTDHVHAHVVLRGRDDEGKDLVIAPDYISAGIRGVASEVATEILGERSLEDIQLGMAGEVSALRVTSLDCFIAGRGKKIEGDDAKIEVNLRGFEGEGRDEFKGYLVRKRLEFLGTTSMAQEVGRDIYHVRSDFRDELKEQSEKHDVIKQLYRSMPEGALDDGVSIYKIGADGSAPVVRGEIEKIANMNELTDNKYMVVRDACDDLHYVTLGLNDRNTSLREGSFVEISAGEKSSLKADRRILEVASASEGVYSRELHLSYVSEYMSYIKEPDGYVDYHGKRVDALEKAGIVDALDGGGYRVPEDAVELGFALSLDHDRKYKKRQQAQVKSLSVLPVLDRGFKVYDVNASDVATIQGRVEQVGLVNSQSDKRFMLVRDGEERSHYVALSSKSDIKEGAIVEVCVWENEDNHNFMKARSISSMPIDTQIDAKARTFLDLEIYRHQQGYDLAYQDADKGTLDAINKRQDWLVDNGYASYKGDLGAFVMKGDALGKLYEEELQWAGKTLAKRHGVRGYQSLDLDKGNRFYYSGRAELMAGRHFIVEQGDMYSLIKSPSNIEKMNMGEPFEIHNNDKGKPEIKRFVREETKEEAIELVTKNEGLSYMEVDMEDGVIQGTFVGALILKDNVYAVVSNDDDFSMFKTREYPSFERGGEISLKQESDGFVEISEIDRQKELELDIKDPEIEYEEKQADLQKLEKEIDDDWGGF